MSKYHVYIVECSDGSLYTGYTTDIDRRMNQHNQGKASRITRTKLPVSLVYYEIFADKSSALKREAEIKTWPRSKKLALVNTKH